MSNFKAFFRLILLIIYTFITVVSAAFINRLCPYRFHTLLMQTWHKFVLRLFNFKLEIKGTIPQESSMLVVSNHSSYLDIMVIGSLIGTHFTPKDNIKNWPIISQMVNSSMPIYINRSNIRTITEQNEKVAQYISSGRNIVIYPEGTTSNGSEVYPFKSGVFSFLTENPKYQNISILPITIIYRSYDNIKLTPGGISPIAWFGDDELLPHIWKMLKAKEAFVTVVFHPKTCAKNFTSRKELSKHCEDVIRKSLFKNLEENIVD